MSRFSQYQKNAYARIFHRFATHESGSISLYDLVYCMPQFGPELSVNQCRELIYHYDSSRRGILSLTDFLIMLGDYEAAVKKIMEDASKPIDAGSGGSGATNQLLGFERQEFLHILRSEYADLSEEEFLRIMNDIFPSEGAETDLSAVERPLFSGLAWCEQKELPRLEEQFVRDIHVSLFRTSSLSAFCTPRMYKQKLLFGSVNPWIRISMGESAVESSVLMHAIKPNWNEDLVLTAKCPVYDLYEVENWFAAQWVTVSLYDYQCSGIVPHSEWLGSATIPFMRILSHAGAAKTYILTINSSMVGVVPIRVELSFRIPSDGVSEYFLPKEVQFMQRYSSKLRHDLTLGLRAGRTQEQALEARLMAGSSTEASSSAGNSKRKPTAPPPKKQLEQDIAQVDLGITFYDYLSDFLTPMREQFARLPFRTLALDEYNTFRILTTFLIPMTIPIHLSNANLLGKLVASIPLGPSQNPSAFPLPPYSDQVVSPATMLCRGWGSELEHAIFLCDLFLGLKLDAYVACGMRRGIPCFWVVTRTRVKRMIASKLKERQRSNDALSNRLFGRFNVAMIRRFVKPKAPVSLQPTGTGRKKDGKKAHRTKAANVIFQASGAGAGAGKGTEGQGEGEEEGEGDDSEEAEVDGDPSANGDEEGFPLPLPLPLPPVKSIVDETSHSERYPLMEWLWAADVGGDPYTQSNKKVSEGDDSDTLGDADSFVEDKFTVKEPEEGDYHYVTTHWNAVTGEHYGEEGNPSCPYESVGSLFNHRNIWVNVQRDDALERALWDLTLDDCWQACLTADAMAYYGPQECWYPMVDLSVPLSRSLSLETSALLGQVVAGIKNYRKNTLFIPETLFFQPICEALQQALSSLLETAPGSAKVSAVSKVNQAVDALLPPGYFYQGHLFMFRSSQPSVILGELLMAGQLSNAIPHCLYVVAVQCCPDILSLEKTMVAIGTVCPIDQLATIKSPPSMGAQVGLASLKLENRQKTVQEALGSVLSKSSTTKF